MSLRYARLGVFERFTERARQVVVVAQDEARALGHNYIGTEHLLLGVLREDEGLAARLLETFEVTLEEARAQVERLVGRGQQAATGMIPFTPRAKKALELSLREAIALGDNYIGTEHILLGLVREHDSAAMRILRDFGLDSEQVRTQLIRMTAGPRRAAGPPPREPPEDVREEVDRIRRQKEEALANMEFERAAALRDRERRLLSGRPEADVEGDAEIALAEFGPSRDRSRLALVGGLVVAALGFPLGLLVGWLIWA